MNRFRWMMALLAALMLALAAPLAAAPPWTLQTTATAAAAAGGAISATCLLWAPVIGIATTLLKQIPFIGKNPKTIAFVLSIAVAATPFLRGQAVPIATLVTCILGQFSGAVATHEVILGPIAAQLT